MVPFKVVSHRYWTVDELVERKLLPRARILEAIQSGELPVVARDQNDDVDVLIDVRDLDWWWSDLRPTEPWVNEWLAYRQTEDGMNLKQPAVPFGAADAAKRPRVSD